MMNILLWEDNCKSHLSWVSSSLLPLKITFSKYGISVLSDFKFYCALSKY